ncbi:MAG: 50S ribosomal protein L4 [Chloroflexota bacterium]|nr:50S ribosomal protein L4 [Chloroflexota bacterium]
MAQAALLRPGDEPAGTVELSEALFAAPVNESLIHQAVVRQLNNRRLGTSDTLTRGLVSGGGKKPWRQKGTGRARQGSRRAPQWAGGGVVFGPHPRSYEQSMPARMRRAALRGVLSAKQNDGRVSVVEDFGLDGIKTRALRDRLTGWDLTGNVLLVLAERDDLVERSARNLPEVSVLLADSLNVVDLLAADWVVFTRAALDRAQEVYR